MVNYYQNILFYHYTGETIVRAYQFNNWQLVDNAISLGATVVKILKANSHARQLCTLVNSDPGGFPKSNFLMLLEDDKECHYITIPLPTDYERFDGER